MTFITARDISAKIPDDTRCFLPISSANLLLAMNDSVNALLEAIDIVTGKVKLNQRVHIIIGTSPFTIALSNGVFSYSTQTQTIHANVENFIFLDFNKINQHPHQLKVACILEELVHALMNVKDENLVSRIVQCLYPHISLNGKGQYVVS